jgi:DNA polymerase-4
MDLPDHLRCYNYFVMPRKILHLDLDAFFCAVEEQRDPSLIGKPFAVGGKPSERGVVASCSYAARQFGIHSAMPMARAVRLCPQLIIVSGRHGDYSAVSERVMKLLRDLTPKVEQVSIDEAFLDVTELPESGLAIARRLQSQINEELKLPCSIGIATNKLVAKVATDVGKSSKRGPYPPNAILEVPPGQEAEFLAPLPTQALWGIGPKTAARLAELDIHTIGDLAARSEAELVRLFGKIGRELWLGAHGIDDSPVVTEHEMKSVSQETTFDHDIADGEVLLQTLYELSEGVGRRLRQSQLSGSTIKLKLRWPDFSTLTRQTTLNQPTDQDTVIFNEAVKLFKQVWEPGKPVRLLGVGVSNLSPRAHQLSLWDDHLERDRRLLEALDSLRERFGSQAIARGRDLKVKKRRS